MKLGEFLERTKGFPWDAELVVRWCQGPDEIPTGVCHNLHVQGLGLAQMRLMEQGTQASNVIGHFLVLDAEE